MVAIVPKYVLKIPGFYIISILVQNYEKSDENKYKKRYKSRDFNLRIIDFSSRN